MTTIHFGRIMSLVSSEHDPADQYRWLMIDLHHSPTSQLSFLEASKSIFLLMPSQSIHLFQSIISLISQSFFFYIIDFVYKLE